MDLLEQHIRFMKEHYNNKTRRVERWEVMRAVIYKYENIYPVAVLT